MSEKDPTALFEARRPQLTGLAYRLLGSLAEAEDAVQETYLRWHQAEQAKIDNPAAWLTTLCTRHCIDLLRSARHARVDYVGAWLPEPIMASDDSPESALALSSSLSTAFLLLLERLPPKERAAYLLHDVFELPYAEVADTLGLKEAACRKLVSRARAHIGRPATGQSVPPDRQAALLDAFQTAITTGETRALAHMMAEEVALRADGGGKVPTLATPLSGRQAVLAFIHDRLSDYWRSYEWYPTTLNGLRGALLFEQGHLQAAVSFGWNDQRQVTGIFIVRNPDKLETVARQADTARAPLPATQGRP